MSLSSGRIYPRQATSYALITVNPQAATSALLKNNPLTNKATRCKTSSLWRTSTSQCKHKPKAGSVSFKASSKSLKSRTRKVFQKWSVCRRFSWRETRRSRNSSLLISSYVRSLIRWSPSWGSRWQERSGALSSSNFKTKSTTTRMMKVISTFGSSNSNCNKKL